MSGPSSTVLVGNVIRGAIMALAVVALAFVAASGRTSQGQGVASVGLDGDPLGNPANTATSLGSRESCFSATANQQFDVDLTIRDVADLWAWQTVFSYTSSVVQIRGITVQNLFQATAHAEEVTSNVQLVTDPQQGSYGAFAYDLDIPAEQGKGDSGTGVLARLSLQAGASPGQTTVELTRTRLDNPVGNPIGDVNRDGYFDGPLYTLLVGVGQDWPDSDDDGSPNPCDNCPDTPNSDQTDSDADGKGDACDNCPLTPNLDQTNSDSDDVGDACDNCPNTDNPGQEDMDSDGLGDLCDPEKDGDGYANEKETRADSDPSDPTSTPEVCDKVDNDGDTAVDEDYDYNENGTPDCFEEGLDSDGDDTPNTLDTDDDNDGFPDAKENYTATDSLDRCPDDALDDAWPADINNDTWADILDLMGFVAGARLGTQEGVDATYDRRFDFNADGCIDILDVMKYVALGILNGQCSQ